MPLEVVSTPRARKHKAPLIELVSVLPLGQNLGGGAVSEFIARGGAIRTSQWSTGGAIAGSGDGTVQMYKGRVTNRYVQGGTGQGHVWWFGSPLFTRPAAALREDLRCTRYTFEIAWAAQVASGNQCGVGLSLTLGSGNGNILVANGLGCAVVISATGPRFIARNVGGAALQEDVALAWPVAATEFAAVEFRIYSATPTADAKLELWVNDVKLLERLWPGATLPDYSAVGSAGTLAVVVAAAAATGAATLHLADLRLQVGPKP